MLLARRVDQISDHGQIYIIVSTLSAKKRNIFSGFYLFCVSCCPGAVPSGSFVAAVPVSYYVSEGGWSGRQTSFGVNG